MHAGAYEHPCLTKVVIWSETCRELGDESVVLFPRRFWKEILLPLVQCKDNGVGGAMDSNVEGTQDGKREYTT